VRYGQQAISVTQAMGILLAQEVMWEAHIESGPRTGLLIARREKQSQIALLKVLERNFLVRILLQKVCLLPVGSGFPLPLTSHVLYFLDPAIYSLGEKLHVKVANLVHESFVFLIFGLQV